MNRQKWLNIGAFLLLVSGASPAVADQTSTAATELNQVAVGSAVDNLATQFALFQTAAQQWVANNLAADGWNQTQTASPYSFGTYSPVLVYAGNGGSGLCGAPAAVTTSYNLGTAGYLPASFAAAFAGEYCAIVYPDSGTTASTGPVGANGGTNTVPTATVNSYLVLTQMTAVEGILSPSTPSFAVSRLGALIAQHYAGGGQVQKFVPTYSSTGTSSSQSAWQSVSP